MAGFALWTGIATVYSDLIGYQKASLVFERVADTVFLFMREDIVCG